jgi:hypothetical protein
MGYTAPHHCKVFRIMDVIKQVLVTCGTKFVNVLNPLACSPKLDLQNITLYQIVKISKHFCQFCERHLLLNIKAYLSCPSPSTNSPKAQQPLPKQKCAFSPDRNPNIDTMTSTSNSLTAARSLRASVSREPWPLSSPTPYHL